MVSEQKKKYHKQWREKNREKINIQKKQYYEQNKEKCQESARKKYYKNVEENRKKGREKKRRWYKKNSEMVMKHYGGNPPKCACCGETEMSFLVLDHINNNGADERKKIGNGNVFSWIIRNGFPSGYQVLCANCNTSKLKNGGICIHTLRI